MWSKWTKGAALANDINAFRMPIRKASNKFQFILLCSNRILSIYDYQLLFVPEQKRKRVEWR